MTTVFNPFMNFGSGGFDFTLDPNQYLYLPGRSGGQLAHGGTDPGDLLELQGSTDADLGLIQFNSPMVVNNPLVAASGQPYTFRDQSSETFNFAFVGGTFADTRAVTFTSTTFVWETLRGSPTITSGANPAFAAFTLFNAIPTLAAGTGAANHNILQALILNAGPQLRNWTGASRTCPGAIGINFAPSLVTNGGPSGSVTTLTNTEAVRCAPVWNTRAGTTVNFGTIRGLRCFNPNVALFGGSAGAEIMDGYYGVDVESITFDSLKPVAAVRSAINSGAASNRLFLQNIGTAPSDHGGAHLHFNDNFGVLFGGTLSGGSDALIRWSAANSVLDFFFSSTSDTLELSSPAADRFLMSSNLFPGNEFNFGFSRFSFGQTSPVGNQVGVFVAPARSTQVNGEWADFLLTQAGNLTIDDTMSAVYAWVINAISLTSGTGSITGHVATFNIGGMTTSGLGSALTHAVRVTGRTTLRGPLSLEPISPTALAADANDWQGQGLGNNAREVVRAEASGADRTITGVDRLQVNDTIYIINVGSTFNIILAHQNASSAAENRMISPTGANLQLGPDEYAFMWHDDTTNRWRILDTNGA